MSDLVAKAKLRDFAEEINGVRPSERSLNGVVDNLIKNYKGGNTSDNYEIKFTFTDQNLDRITITGLIPKDKEVTDFIVLSTNTQLESIGLPDRVANVKDVIDLANKYKDNLGAVVTALLCSFAFGKIISTSLVVYSYFFIFGEEDYDDNCWYIIVTKTSVPTKHRIAEFSGDPYNITTSYLEEVSIK